MQGNREQIECEDNRLLAASENRVMQWGSPGSSHTIAEVRGITYYNWVILCDLNVNFSIEVSTDRTFATFQTLLTQSTSPNVLTTPYLLAGGNRDFITCSMPFMRLRVVEPDAQTPTVFSFMFKGWS
jgi:hypothetical protein